MKHINRVVMLGDIDNSPLAKYMNAKFLYTGAYNLHRLPVTRLKS